MNTTLNRLIRLNVELEGALRVAAAPRRRLWRLPARNLMK